MLDVARTARQRRFAFSSVFIGSVVLRVFSNVKG
jgi:hypothetical protein